MNSIFNGIRLIIFDLDGTLIHSQPLQYEAFNTIFSQYGPPITKKEWVKYWIHQSCTAKRWIEMKQLDLNHEKITIEKRKLYKKLVLEKLELKSGALELIKKLSVKYPLCIASATYLGGIKMIVKKFNIENYFSKLISDADVKNRKPAPDVFLVVAKLMKVSPKNCLVFEDSLAGLQAVQAAGMKCVICPDIFSNIPSSKFQNADLIINNLNEIIT